MKSYILTLGLLLCSLLHAQENVQDYILPAVNNERYLYSSTSSNLSGDLAEIEKSSYSLTYQYQGIYQEDGSILYKIIRFDDALIGAEDHAYFLGFSGSTASLKGYSKYETETDFFFDYVVDEKYETQSSQTMYKAPNESYQMLDWTFTDPHTSQLVTAKSSYKTVTVGGYEKRLLVVEFKTGTQTRREYYMKYFGLIATQETSGTFYIADLRDFKLFSKSFMDEKKEEGSRKLGWTIIRNLRNINSDSVSTSGSAAFKLYQITMDSLYGLYEHMMIRNPEMQNAYRYIIASFLYEATRIVYDKPEKEEKLSSSYFYVMKPVSNYFFIRPAAESISKNGLNQYITNVDGNYYPNYWKMNYYIMKAQHSNNDFRKSYVMYLFKSRVDEILKNEANIDNYNKCILYSYVAAYYFYKGEPEKRYYYLVKYIEYFKYLSQEDKDINIEYMRGVMTTLTTLSPGTEEVLISAINAVLELKDYPNAMKIADNGYQKAIGMSLAFALRFAEAAYKDEVNKPYLRKAMLMLQNKYGEMTVEQINQYLIYCRAMVPEFDCSKAEAEVLKAQKREKEQQEKKEKEAKRNQRNGGSSYSGSGSRRLNFAIAANPFAGLNIKGSGGIFKYLPVSAELRTGTVLHEVRVNTFFGLSAENRFVGGKVLSDVSDKNAGWKNITGSDYSYGIFFVKNDISSYQKTCSSIGGGFQFLYGNFSTDAEQVTYTFNNLSYTKTFKPQVTRYEALVNFKYAMFSWKSHLYATFFYGLGAGMREITYNPQDATVKEDDLKDPAKTVFDDRRYVQQNWGGAYFTFRMGFRFGFTIF